jgi:hypothetical protein
MLLLLSSLPLPAPRERQMAAASNVQPMSKCVRWNEHSVRLKLEVAVARRPWLRISVYLSGCCRCLLRCVYSARINRDQHL